MKYSEAIRNGVQFKRQGFGSMFGESSNIFLQAFGVKPKPTSCVMGAALDGAGILVQLGGGPFSGNAFVRVGTNSNPNAVGHVTLPKEWMGLLTFVTDCPDCGVTAQIGYLMPHLNDYHRWTRERIAAWIERVEVKGEWYSDGRRKRVGTIHEAERRVIEAAKACECSVPVVSPEDDKRLESLWVAVRALQEAERA